EQILFASEQPHINRRGGPRRSGGTKNRRLRPWGHIMDDRTDRLAHPRSSRQRFRGFVHDYQRRRLDEPADARKDAKPPDGAASADEAAAPDAKQKRRGKRREYL